ncbi:MAG: FCD domain-containing protein [Gordonia sp. (in: high G+C Gram-positive bacteria)]
MSVRNDLAGSGPTPLASGTERRAAAIARLIEADIVSSGWRVGRALGSESALREHYGVSRAVLREAIRLVEHRQLAQMRRGPGGGLFVTAPDAATASRALVIYLDHLGTTADDVLHARILLEPLATAMAIDALDQHGVDTIRGDLARESASGATTVAESMSGLHRTLARMSGNAVLELFIGVLTHLTVRYAARATICGCTDARSPTRDTTEHHWATEHHRAIADAVIAGDTIRAQAMLTEHLETVCSWLSAHPVVGTEAEVATDTGPSRMHSVPTGPTPDIDTKLAELIAARIHDHISHIGWPVGKVLGSEAELLNHYRVSRAVLREAVRILEYHSVARMRRGPGGGLVVTEPDPGTSIESMALYLEYHQVKAVDLHAVRSAIELGIVSLVTAHAIADNDLADNDLADNDLAERNELAERLVAAVNWVTEGPADTPRKADRFHTELAAAAGNPVLSLFLSVITELFRRHSSRHTHLPGDRAAADVRHAHQHILDAIRQGDVGIARQRMRRHLDALAPWYG